jgi:D-alanine-D-alanine ligase-like ATP-grasp enzyme
MSKTCIYCGNNPVNHFSTRLGNRFTLILRPRKPDSLFQRLSSRAAHAILRASLALFRILGIARLNTDVSRTPSARGKVLWDEAVRRGIVMYGYELFGTPADTYRAVVNGRPIVFAALPRPIVSESGSEYWLDDKWLLKQRLLAAGIPAPRGGCATTCDVAKEVFRSLQKPVVVKPRIGSRGRHTTTHITNETELVEAFNRAIELCPSVVIEEHLKGAVYRGTVIGGKLAGVLAGEPPRVVGDGMSSIRELVFKKNAGRHEKVHAVDLGKQHEEFLSRTGASFETVPERGAVVYLIEKIGVSYGGHSAEVSTRTHPDIKTILERAAEVAADPIVGFDFIIPDISKSPRTQKWGIIECNTLPFINLHYDPVEGEPVNVASVLWEYVEANTEKF